MLTCFSARSILSKPPRADKALENMQKALEINPDDGEVCYNLGESFSAGCGQSKAVSFY